MAEKSTSREIQTGKVKFLKEEYKWRYGPLYRAFTLCLSPNEVCQLLDLNFSQSSSERNLVLKRIAEDASEDFQECHRSLFEVLIKCLQTFPPYKRKGCAHALEFLYSSIPHKSFPLSLNKSIMDVFLGLLTIDKITYRERAYRMLWGNLSEDYLPQIESAWRKWGDTMCAQLIIDNFPLSFLVEHLDELAQKVSFSRYYPELFVRTSEQNPKVLNRLREEDGITYAYVLCRRGEKLDSKSALEIFEKFKMDERLGLLLWCFGKMGLWKILRKVYQVIMQNNKEYTKRMGIYGYDL